MSDPGAKREGESRRPLRRPLRRQLSERLSGLRVGIAGPGRVGRSYARWLRAAGADLRLIVSRTPASLDPSRANGASANDPLRDVPKASFDSVFDTIFAKDYRPDLDVLLLTVSDDALAEVARRWAQRWAQRWAANVLDQLPFRVVLHSSGCFDSEILAPLRALGVSVGSLHPLRAFPDMVTEPGPDPFFAIDGDAGAMALARRIAEALGGTTCELSGERRVVYHLAASLAAGGVATTLAMVTELMDRADLPGEVLDGYLDLLRGAVDAAERRARDQGPGALASAITGPAARGDESTIQRHRRALLQVAPELAPTVESLWRETGRQARGKAGGEAVSDGSGEHTPEDGKRPTGR